MTEEDTEGLGVAGLEEGGLQDSIAHWVEVLDRWVKGIDSGMGRQDGDVEHLNDDGSANPTRPLVEGPGAGPAAGVSE